MYFTASADDNPMGIAAFVASVKNIRCHVVLLCLAMLLSVSACSREAPVLTGATMGTSYSVIVPHLKQSDQNNLKSAIDAELVAVNNAMSTYQDDTTITLFNHSSSTDWFDVPQSFSEVLYAALVIAEATDGAFDPTVSPLVKRWGFDTEQANDLPSTEEITFLVEQIGFRKIALNKSTSQVRKTESHLRLDLNAMAKGYAVDLLAKQVESLGYDDYLVEIGGELRVSGENVDGDPWRIGIERPQFGSSDGNSQSGLHLRIGAVATSGDYRNAFEHNGKRYSHIIDARNGAPVNHGLASVTVVAESAMLADGWATALMVMGPDEGMQIAEKLGLACFFIVRNQQKGFQTRSSSAFRELEQN